MTLLVCDGHEAEHFAAVSQDELRVDLTRALESLPEIYREIILLRDMEQFTISEAADHLDITREACKSRLHRARTLLREYLRPEAEWPPDPRRDGRCFAVWRGQPAASAPGWALLMGLSALVVMRGCPVCWTIGLFETIWQKRSLSDGQPVARCAANRQVAGRAD